MKYAVLHHTDWPGAKVFAAPTIENARKAAKDWLLERTKDEMAEFIAEDPEAEEDWDSWLDHCFDNDWMLLEDDGDDPYAP